MLVAIAVLLTQSSPSADALSAGLKDQDAILSRVIDCVDADAKVQMKAHFSESTPETVADAAIKTCASVFEELRLRSVTTLSDAMPRDAAEAQAGKLLADTRKSLRDAEIKHLDEFMAGPVFAESRFKVAVGDWSLCAKGKAVQWSKLKDEARTVAEAAVTACSSFKPNVEIALRYYSRSLNLPASYNADQMTKIETSIGSNAVRWVIEERAKALPK